MISAEQRELRRRFIGSSDSAAIMGLDPYRSAADVFLEKTGRAEGFAGNKHTERGNILEPAIVEWFRQESGLECLPNVMRVHANAGMCANLDAINDLRRFIVEAKSTVESEEWGEEKTDQIPERHLVQVHHGLYVTGFELCYVPVLVASFRAFEFKLYEVHRNNDLADLIAEKATEFMEKYVRTDTPPADFKPSLEVLKRVRRQAGKTVPLPELVVKNLIIQKEQAKRAAEAAEEAQAAVLAQLGDADAGDCGGGLSVTYFEQHRKAYEVKPSSFRVLKIKQPKGE